MPEQAQSSLSSDSPILISAWLTSADRSHLFERQTEGIPFNHENHGLPEIHLNADQRYQSIEGFGFSLTGGSAMLICRLPDAERGVLLRELFVADEEGIGISFLRLSIGASDLSERCFSYHDMEEGQSDSELDRFDIDAGDTEVIPLLLEILAINPSVKIIAAPWSAPIWMKTNRHSVGGKLRPDCYGVYAAYLVKYLQAMQARGITVHALTPQNEPLNEKNQPSMVMEAEEQTEFVKHHLGPALHDAGLGNVELFCWDHNCDKKEYPLTVFADPEARRFLSGSAWHLYGGDISALSEVHREYPDMKLYFTEQWVGSDGQFGGDLIWHMRNVLIGATRNWSRVVLEWNLASDPNCCPHTPGGEARCVGALTIGDTVERNVAYYVIAHAAKSVRPGSVRIASDASEALPNVAFLTPKREIVLIVLNDSGDTKNFAIRFHGQTAATKLPAYTVATYLWRCGD